MRKAHLFILLFAALAATAAFAQTPPATAPITPPVDDTPKGSLGAMIFADYTYQQSPRTKDTDGNTIHPSSFNISRAYINVTANLNHRIAFPLTPQRSRATTTTSATPNGRAGPARAPTASLAPSPVSTTPGRGAGPPCRRPT